MKYFKYVIKNIEPLRIADDSSSQSGQTVSLRYIPGTTIRGLVVNKLAGDSNFESVKKTLFSDKVRFLNAYLSKADKELIPTPKGFYEDKTIVEGKKPIQNVVISGDFSEGYKRAAMGGYCYIDDDCINYYSVNSGSDLRIKINQGKDNSMFRNEYIAAGHTFVGYIALDDENSKDFELIESCVADIFEDRIIIGNGRSQGLGKCKVIEKSFIDTENFLPYGDYAVKGDISGSCYMMLLSNAAMRGENGEYTGLDMAVLENLLGVSELKIEQCSTSVVDVKGYNRAWGVKIPTVTMYEMGSVFKLSFSGEISADKLYKVMNAGIGVRRNEGFGRIIVLKDYEKIAFKKKGEEKKIVNTVAMTATDDDKKVLKVVAAVRYRKLIDLAQKKMFAENTKISISKSQIGNVRSILEKNRYNADECRKNLDLYFSHANEKFESQRSHKEKTNTVGFANDIKAVFDNDLKTVFNLNVNSIMGYPLSELLSADEVFRIKINYLLNCFKYDGKRG